jgi:hypothetical protein
VTMKDSHAEKGAHNQALIREVNERIVQVAEDAAHPEFLCECADTNCVEMIELSIAEYESIRSSPVRFPVKLGHDYPEFERVVEEREHYAIFEKFGQAAEIVKEARPAFAHDLGSASPGWVIGMGWTMTRRRTARS